MFRWTFCCCLVLGTTAVAQAKPNAASPNPGDSQTITPNFGLQVQMGADGQVRTQSRPKREVATYASYSDDQTDASKGDRLSAVNWQEPVPAYMDAEPMQAETCYEWQVLPVGLMYKAYLAGEKESRMQAVWFSSAGRDGMIWETALGGHVGLLRYGTTDSINPEGWQFDLEGAALPRVDLGHESDLEACDFRAGFLSTWRFGPNAFKAGYYHLSSHVGDEFLIRNIGFKRRNYVRDSAIIGWTRDLTLNTQVYGEVAYAFGHNDGAEPLELQYGIQYSPMVFGLRGAPFAAVNGHTRQEFGYTTSINITGGWQWRGVTNHTYRMGMQYYSGPAMQYSFVGMKETLVGGGLWVDY